MPLRQTGRSGAPSTCSERAAGKKGEGRGPGLGEGKRTAWAGGLAEGGGWAEEGVAGSVGVYFLFFFLLGFKAIKMQIK